jgi:hypothetical protein
MAAEPAIAKTEGGALVVYVEHNGKDGADVYVQSADAGGKLAGERVRVNEVPNAAKAWKGDPPTIAVGSDGAVFVGWTRKYSDAGARGNDLVLSVSRDGGRTFGAPVKVNDDEKPASHGMHSLAVSSDGRVVMAWLDERNIKPQHEGTKVAGSMHHDNVEPNSEVFTAVSNDGGRTFSKNVRIADNVCPCCKTALLSMTDGTVYAAWRQVLKGDFRHIAVAVSNDGGRQFGPAVIVSDDQWQLSACPVSGAGLASAGNGDLEVFWYTGGKAGKPGLYTARSSDGGKTFGERRLVSDAANGGTPAYADNSVAFTTGDGIVIIRATREAAGQGPATIANASVPAAMTIDRKTLVAYVRTAGDRSAVWLETLSN